MLSLEQVSQRIFSHSTWILHTVIGGLVLMIPIAWFFPMGLWIRQMEKVQQDREYLWPSLEPLGALFLDGIRFFLVFLLYAGIPLLVAWGLGLLLISFLGPLGFFPIIPVFLTAPALVGAALYHLLRRDRDWAALVEFPAVWNVLRPVIPWMILPTLAFNGVLLTFFPLAPWAFFLGYFIFLSYLSGVFLTKESLDRSTHIA